MKHPPRENHLQSRGARTAVSNDFALASGGPAAWVRVAMAAAPGAAERRALARAGVRVWAVPSGSARAGDPAWMRDTAAAALQPAIWVAAADLTEAVLTAWQRLAHQAGLRVLVIVERDRKDIAATPPSTGAALPAFAGLQRRLARLDLPNLRFAAPTWPPCQTADWVPDVVLRPNAVGRAGPAGSPDARCAPCAVRATCAGPQDDRDTVQPVLATVSNQFDVVRVAQAGEVPATAWPGDHCDAIVLLDADPALPPTLWAPSGAAIGTADLALAFARGQLYCDVSSQERLDDFAAQLQALDAVHAPHALPDGRSCAGVWRVRAAEPFGAEEAALRAELVELMGTVVDVGAGPVRYLDVLRPAIASGRLRYVAVEPDATALRTLAAALPGAATLQGRAECLPLRPAVADAVVLLRSWNHVRDPAAAVRELARVCRPGAVVLAVDNVAFGLLRTPEQLRRAHAVSVAQTPFEHFRNDDAPDFAAALARWAPGAFAVQDCHAVRPGGSNQWRVRALRTGARLDGRELSELRET
ncbi:MAG: class I SAM-dependent methyltransferase [Myxococcales bacterium]|nr:class I SAM-dependent methyltransferase [Myxococcales bacterium]